MNPLCRVVGMVIVTVHHIHIAGEKVVPTPAELLKFPAHMVKGDDLQEIILVIRYPFVWIQAVLCVAPAVCRIKRHPHTFLTSSSSSVK